MVKQQLHSWIESAQSFFKPQALALFFLGISAGIPLLLIFSSLSLWLREAGIERGTVTFFSWAALAYSFKFIWAPIVSHFPLPFLTRLLGQRRGWLLFSQVMVAVAIVAMGCIDPSVGGSALILMAAAATGLGFSSATQDIVVDAFRIESADKDFQALLSSMYIAGYRVGMLISGAGALYIADCFGSNADQYSYSAWQLTYWLMACTMLIGLTTTLLVREPVLSRESEGMELSGQTGYLSFFLFFVVAVLCFIGFYRLTGGIKQAAEEALMPVLHNAVFADVVTGALQLICAVLFIIGLFRLFVSCRIVNESLVKEAYLLPVMDFFKRFTAKQVGLILLLIAFYRVSDLVLGAIANIFYQDLGFTKSEIAKVVKVFGLIMTLLGGFLGGMVAIRYGVIKTLALGALLTVLTNLLFMLMAEAGHNVPLFYIVISADNLAGGLASAAFVAYLSSLVNLSFTASQYAIFSSIMTLFPKILAGYSGSIVDAIGYSQFFLIGSLIGLPVLWVIYALRDIDQ